MDDGLKQRLVGAFVLLALGVLFVPVLFDPDGRQGVDTTTQIPVAPQPAPTLVVPIPDPARPQNIEPAKTPELMFAGEDAAVEESAADSEADVKAVILADANTAQASTGTPNANTPTTTPSTTTPSTTSTAAANPTPATSEGLTPSGIPMAWTVQVSSHQLADKANVLRDQLVAQGYKAYTRTVSSGKVPVTRVYVGPNVEQAEALAVKAAVDKSLKVNSIVLRFEP